MDIRIILHFAIYSLCVTGSSATTSCTIDDYQYSCQYTIICEGHAGSANNPTCESEPNVTFVILRSSSDTLTPGFFGSTNFDSRVRIIKARENIWYHINPLAFRYYGKTVSIDLSGNRIQTIQSEAFRNLVFLKYLNLSMNEITTLFPDSFFISESKTTDLNELDLSYNRLTELSSDGLSQLPNLNKLHLQHNNIYALADDCFNGLKFLTHLYLQHNRLTSVNMTLINLKMLTVLDVSSNYLLKLAGYEFTRLIGIENLNVSYNNINVVDTNCFNQAVNLKVVDFSFNNLSSNLEDTIFLNNAKLSYLNFYKNNIRHIKGTFKSTNLTYLNIENNNLSGSIDGDTFAGLHNILELNLNGQNISNIGDNAFSNMTSLVHLYISKNHIVKIENASFENTPLSILDLSYNNINDLNFIKNNLENLTELYLNNNNITVILESTFENKLFIKKLDISMNQIVTFEKNSLPLLSLQYLYVEGNKLGGTITSNIFSPSKFLRFLDLSRYNITKIDQLAFAGLPVLARLNLSHNAIESINPLIFKGVDNMLSLDISFNNLSDIEFNSTDISNLKALFLNNNKLKNITRIFSGSTKLVYVDLSYNNISDISNIGASLLPNITVLHINNNNIRNFNNPQTNSLTTLVELSLASNGISSVNLSYFKELMIVNLSNNNLNFLNSSLFVNVDRLQALDVSNNRLTELPPGTFRNMKNLKLVNISSNFLTRLRYGSLMGLHKTEVLDLSRNSITELDVDIFHECTELSTLLIDYNFIKKLDVERLILTAHKLKALSFGGNPISCKEITRNVRPVNSTYFVIQQVQVTSIDKIYHEDNVHGIKCGDDIVSTTTAEPEASGSQADSTTFTLLIVFLIVVSLLIGGGVLFYFKFIKGTNLSIGRDIRVQMRNSLELNGSEFQADLLS